MPSSSLCALLMAAPKLLPYEKKFPPDPNTLELKLASSNTVPAIAWHHYSNGCYAFSWYEDELQEKGVLWASNGKGFLKIKAIHAAKVVSSRKRASLHILPAKLELHEEDLLAPADDTLRLILVKTLLDLDSLLEAEYGLHVLTPVLRQEYALQLS